MKMAPMLTFHSLSLLSILLLIFLIFPLISALGNNLASITISTDKKECMDSKYYLNKLKLFDKQSANSPLSCPLTYQIAKILPNDKAAISRASKFLFVCLGPLKEAWILKPDTSSPPHPAFPFKNSKDKETSHNPHSLHNLHNGNGKGSSAMGITNSIINDEDLWTNETTAKLIAPEAIEKRLIRFSIKNVQDKGQIQEINEKEEKITIDLPVLCEKRQ